MSRNYHQTVTKSLDTKQPTTLRENDVVLFRGAVTNNHKGSERWRAMVKNHTEAYLAATSNHGKRAIVLECIRIHQASGGRYVGKHQGQYFVATPQKAYTKTAQKLRDYAKEYTDSITPVPLDDGLSDKNSSGLYESDLDMAGHLFDLTKEDHFIDGFNSVVDPDLADDFDRFLASLFPDSVHSRS